MSEITIKFELSEWEKVKEFFDFHKIDTCTSESEKDNEIRGLNDDIKRLEDENSNLKQQVQKYSEKEKEYSSELERIENEKEKQIESLKEQNENFKKLLERNGLLSINGEEIREEIFFNINGENLEVTVDHEAPFVGNIVDMKEESAVFRFNISKGPHKDFSQHKSELEKFCIISSSIAEANYIENVKCGKGKLYNSRLLVVNSKAEIKLTRK